MSAVLLIGAPGLMLGGSAYAGEILFRLYFFALPFLVFFIAACIYPSRTLVTSRRRTVLAFVLSMCLLGGFLLPYYGHEGNNYITKEEFEAAQYLHNVAPPGTLLVDGSPDWLQVAYRNYEDYSYYSLGALPAADRIRMVDDPVNELINIMQKGQYSDMYITLTRSQKSYADSLGLLPHGGLHRIQQQLSQSNKFQVVFVNQDAIIFTLGKDVRDSG